MMQGVATLPETVGCKGQNADEASRPVIGTPVAKERTMPAIVLDHEQPDQESGRGQRQHQSDPIAMSDQAGGKRPESHEWQKRDQEFQQAASVARLVIVGKDVRPGAGVFHRGGGLGSCDVRQSIGLFRLRLRPEARP